MMTFMPRSRAFPLRRSWVLGVIAVVAPAQENAGVRRSGAAKLSPVASRQDMTVEVKQEEDSVP